MRIGNEGVTYLGKTTKRSVSMTEGGESPYISFRGLGTVPMVSDVQGGCAMDGNYGVKKVRQKVDVTGGWRPNCKLKCRLRKRTRVWTECVRTETPNEKQQSFL